MGSSVRRFVFVAGVTGIALATSLAFAQVPASTGAPPPPGGGSTAPPAPAPTASAAPDKFTTGGGDVGGFTFDDKPKKGAAPAAPPRFVRRASGPQATFPGFEQLTDGGSRLFVQLSQTVPVEQRMAAGSITYVLKGAHLRVHNDTNALVTVHFNTPVYRARLTSSGSDLLFVLEMRSAAAPTFKVQDNPDHTSTLQIDFAKGDFLGNDSAVAPEERAPGTTPSSGTVNNTAPQQQQTPRGGGRGRRGNSSAPVTNAGPTP